MFHVLLHVPDAMFRWNAVRNFWGFFGERTMGYLIRHIHNRDLAAENIMTAYVRLRFILKTYPQTINNMVSRFTLDGMSLPKGGSTLTLATEVRIIHISNHVHRRARTYLFNMYLDFLLLSRN